MKNLTSNSAFPATLADDVGIVICNVKEYLNSHAEEFGYIGTMLDELTRLIRQATDNKKDSICDIFREIRENCRKDKASLSPLLSGSNPLVCMHLFKRYFDLYMNDVNLWEEPSMSEDFSQSSYGRISYVKNNFTEKAFWSFSKAVKDQKAHYCSSFEGACEDVYNGISEYSILPIENALDGKLISFYSLIDKYDLKISSVCDVDYNDSSSSTKFALLKKNFDVYDRFADPSSEAFLEISFTQSENLEVIDLLNAADFFSLKMVRMDSVKLAYSDDQYKFYSVFSAQRTEILRFLAYLYIYAPESLPIGIYKRI